MLRNFTAKSAMIFFPIFCKGWMRVQTIRPHLLLILENEGMLMKLLLRADIQGWQKRTFWNEFRTCSLGVWQLLDKVQWPGAHLGTSMPTHSKGD